MFSYRVASEQSQIAIIAINGPDVIVKFRSANSSLQPFAMRFPDDYQFLGTMKYQKAQVQVMTFRKSVNLASLKLLLERWNVDTGLAQGRRVPVLFAPEKNQAWLAAFAKYQQEKKCAENVVQTYNQKAHRLITMLEKHPNQAAVAAFKATIEFRKFHGLLEEFDFLATLKSYSPWLQNNLPYLAKELPWKYLAPATIKTLNILQTRPHFGREFDKLLQECKPNHYMPKFSNLLDDMQADLSKLYLLSHSSTGLFMRIAAVGLAAAYSIIRSSPLGLIPFAGVMLEYLVTSRRDKAQYNALVQLGENPRLAPAQERIFQAGKDSQASYCPQLAVYTNKAIREDLTTYHAGQAAARLNNAHHRPR
jgi:hypothetical protein